MGEATHLYAVNPEEVRKGNIALKDVPYMQRGGSWDNSDLKGKAGWMNTGFGMRAYNDAKGDDDLTARAKKNGLTNDQQMWRDSSALTANEIARMNRSRGGGAPKINTEQKEKEKKFFGLF